MSMRYLVYALLLAATGYLLTGVTQVLPGERAVVRRFGQVVDKPGPGLRIGLPYGMDRVDRVAVDLIRRVRVGYLPETEDSDQTTPPGQLLTGDHNLVNVQVILDYAVDNDGLEEYVVQAERADGVISRAAEAELTGWVAGRTVDEVLIHGKSELPGLLVRQTQARIRPYRLGVVIQGANVAYLYPPDEVKRAFEEVAQAQTGIRTREHVARQEAATKLRGVEAERFRIEKQAAAYVTEQLALARAEAESFEKRSNQYRRLREGNPHFLAGIWWEEVGRLFQRLKDDGRLDLLDNRLGSDGLDITISPALPKKRSDGNSRP